MTFSAASDRDAEAVPPHGRPVFRLIAFLTLAALLAITVVFPGATRMYASPWSLVAAFVFLGPACLLALRGFDRTTPLVLPARRWCVAAFGAAGVLLASALTSPYRSSAVLWSAPLLSAVAVFLLAFDWLHVRPEGVESRRTRAWQVFGIVSGMIAFFSIAEWLTSLQSMPLSHIFENRNPYPLGHSNYTAGLALLFAPCLAVLLLRHSGGVRFAAAAALLLALTMLFTSGSRGGALAAGLTLVIGLSGLPVRKGLRLRIGAVALVAAGMFIAANPRTRALFSPSPQDAPPNVSNVQRSAMALAGARMGSDRPLLGWGPGTTPLAFPRYRAGLEGGAENVLQLHSLPVQLWAELGGAGVTVALLGLVLLLLDGRRDRLAAATLAGYALFSLFDAQLDVPVFGFCIAFLAALIAAPVEAPDRPKVRLRLAGLAAVACVAVVAFLGRQDRAPVLNSEALRIGRNEPTRAIALLRESLRLNPDQELVHFNLGWLLVVDDPAEAAAHFIAAARLAPDKGGVYLGLGLARLNGGDTSGAAHALALEALNDPVFVLSPWWNEPQLKAVRADTLRVLDGFHQALDARLPVHAWAARENRYLQALTRWLSGSADARDVAVVADTPIRRQFFSASPGRVDIQSLDTRLVTYERVGYPVLVRNLDLAPPVDVWVSRESSARQSSFAFLWPEKGWVPSPHLIALLGGRELRHN